MRTITVGGTEYRVADCGTCGTTGVGFDPTCADSIAPGPYANRCRDCSGRGRTYVNMQTEARQRQDRLELEAHLASQELGDMPDWML